MPRAMETSAKPVQLPASLAHTRRNLYNLNLGYLLFMKNVGEIDMTLAAHIFSRIPEHVIEKIANAPYQVLADLAKVLTVTPVLRSDVPETVWTMMEGVIVGKLEAEDLGAYVLSLSGKQGA